MMVFLYALAGYVTAGLIYAARLMKLCKRMRRWDDTARKAARLCVPMWPVAVSAEIRARRDFRAD